MRCNFVSLLPAVAVIHWALIGLCRADTIIKHDGGKVIGVVLEEESDDSNLTVRTRFGKQRISRRAIKEIRYGGDSVQDYDEAAKAYADTAEDQLKLALWCLEHKYRKEYAKHLQRVIELDPDHPEARRRLGFQFYEGNWMTLDEIKESQGFVKHNGKWILPQEKDQAEKDGDNKKNRQEWYKKVRLWRTWLRSEKSDRYDEALKSLREIKDPAAARPLFETFTDRKTVDSERRVLVETLAGIPGGEATGYLVKVALNDNVESNRQLAAEKLKDRKSPELVGEVLKFLKSNENDKVNRAAAILGEIGDSTVYVALVDALITKHKYVHEPGIRDMIQKQQGVSQRLGGYSVQPDGTVIGPSVMTRLRAEGKVRDQQQGGFSWGQPQTQTFVEELENPDVLRALSNLTGENFGYDKSRWLKWVKDDERARTSKIRT